MVPEDIVPRLKLVKNDKQVNEEEVKETLLEANRKLRQASAKKKEVASKKALMKDSQPEGGKKKKG
jgi:hypothetical protein